jgi:hypothetical protein
MIVSMGLDLFRVNSDATIIGERNEAQRRDQGNLNVRSM